MVISNILCYEANKMIVYSNNSELDFQGALDFKMFFEILKFYYWENLDEIYL